MLNPSIRIIIWFCLQQQIRLYNFPEVNIVTVAPEALEAGNATKASAATDLTTNITAELSIQSDEVLPNQATAPCHQGTHVRQSTKHAAEAEALRQHKWSRRT